MANKPTYEELEQRIIELEHSKLELELNFQRAQKISRIGSWDWDPTTDEVTHTDMIFEIFGINKADFEGSFASMLSNLVHPDDRAIVEEAAEKAQATGVGSDVTYRVIRPDGELRWIHALGEFIFEDGQLIKVIGTNQDITDHKIAESALKDSENKYRVLTENTSLGIGVSKGFEMLYANQSLLDMFQIDSIDRFNEKPPLEYCTPESKKEIGERIRKKELGEKVPEELAVSVIRSNGELGVLELYFSDIIMDDEVCRMITFNDVTEKRQTENALIDSELRFRQLAENSLDLICSTDFDGNFIYINKAGMNILGQDQKTLMSTNLLSLVHPDEKQATIDAMQSLSEGLPVIDFQNRYIISGKKDVWLSWRAVPDVTQQRVFSIGRDISKQKIVEEQLRNAKKNAEQANQAKPRVSFWPI